MENVNFLQKSYETVVNGNIPGVDSAADLAAEYLKAYPTKINAATALVRKQCLKTGLCGFITGVPGGLALPVTLSADLATTFIVNLKMVCAIAKISGLELKDDKVQTLVFLTLVGESIEAKFLRPMGTALAETIGKKLITMSCSKAAVGKAIPFIGGLIGGGLDSLSTASIGAFAIKTFLSEENINQHQIAA